MNWIKENKFLTGYFAVLLIATGVLAYLLFDSKGRYDEVASNYEAQASELHRLRTLPLFPNAPNLKLLVAQKEEEKLKIAELQKNLAVAKLPVEAMTPEQFQDKLRAAVTDFEKRANEVGMALPKGFYMGFDPYQSIPPKPAAAPLLGRELKAIEMILDELSVHGIAEIKALTRENLPEEETGTAKPEQSRNAGPGSGRGQPGRADKPALILQHSIDLTFLAPKGGAQFILNSIVSNKFQLMIPRLIVLKNEKDKGPLREVAPPPIPDAAPPNPQAAVGTPPNTQAPGAVPASAPAPTPADTGDAHKFIVGDERVETSLHVEFVDVAELPVAKPVAAQ